MNIGELKEYIKDLPDDALVVVPSWDHSFNKANVYFYKIVAEDGGLHLSEYFHNVPVENDCYVQPAKVIGALIVN